MVKEFIWFFQNRAPRGTKVFFYSNGSIVKESVCQDGLITNNDHQSLRDPRYSELGNIFIFYFFGTDIYSLFRNINKIQNDKMFETQVHLFHAHADIKARFTYFKSTFRNENIHEQKQGDSP